MKQFNYYGDWCPDSKISGFNYLKFAQLMGQFIYFSLSYSCQLTMPIRVKQSLHQLFNCLVLKYEQQPKNLQAYKKSRQQEYKKQIKIQRKEGQKGEHRKQLTPRLGNKIIIKKKQYLLLPIESPEYIEFIKAALYTLQVITSNVFC